MSSVPNHPNRAKLSSFLPPELNQIPPDLYKKTGVKKVPRLLGIYTVVAHGSPLAVTWYSFGHPDNKRWPHYYGCLLRSAMVKNGISLYSIGAAGNKHQVDVLATNLQGDTLKDDLIGASTALKDDAGSVELKGGFYEADLALWSPVDPAGAENNVIIKSEDDCILWVISYRGKGKRGRPGWRVNVSKGKKLLQDDDGSPPDGIPGGEHDEP